MFSRIPHWEVGQHRYVNQFQAWLAATQLGQVPKFNLFEQAFDQVDWSQDPAESWDQLVKARCLQLRHKYKNLILLYSGGRDSHHILRSFAKYNIPIDELILVHWPLNPIRSHDYTSWIRPMAERYKHHNSRVKITTLEIGLDDYKKWFVEDWSEQSVAILDGLFQPSDFTWMVQQKYKSPHSNTGVMCGLEKPEIVLKNNKLYSTLGDRCFLFYFNSLQIIEFFYITPDLPELHVKQSRMIVDHLTVHYPEADSKFITEFQYPRGDHYDEFAQSTGRGPAVDISSSCQNGKGKYIGNHPVFQLLKKTVVNQDPKIWNYYQENLQYFYNQNHMAINRPDYFWAGPQVLKSKPYYLCDWPAKK
jgi:hypothetical protein